MLRTVQNLLNRESIGGHPLVVAFSGGPDSLALLWALTRTEGKETRFLGETGFLTRGSKLVAAHLNHQLRGDESDADQAFVESFCREHQIELQVARRDVRQLAQDSGENLESTARRIRYEWLADVARECNAPWVATGHTADDQAETVLHHLLRGTGLRGLRGIAPRRPLAPGIDLIRPLLKVTRQDVLNFLESEELTGRHDRSNDDLGLTRNRIRHQLLPLLRQSYQPEIVAVLCRLAEQAAQFYAVYEQEAAELLSQVERPRAGSMIVLDADQLAQAPRHIVREMFHLIWQREGWPANEMTFEHWDRLAALIFERDIAHDFPGGVRGRRKGNVAQLFRG